MRAAFRSFVRLALLTTLPAGLFGAVAVADDHHKGLSERTVRVLQSLAWDRMPARIEGGDDDEAIELDKSDPQKFLLPLDDARRIIVNADRSATASLCNLEEEAVVNFLAMMDIERAREKWTREQLHMIKWIYLAVLEVRTAHIEDRDKEVALTAEEAAEFAQDPDRQRRHDFDCSEETRQTVKRQIADYAHSASTN